MEIKRRQLGTRVVDYSKVPVISLVRKTEKAIVTNPVQTNKVVEEPTKITPLTFKVLAAGSGAKLIVECAQTDTLSKLFELISAKNPPPPGKDMIIRSRLNKGQWSSKDDLSITLQKTGINPMSVLHQEFK